tara:strand:+ start:3434 stop:3673 length:240 start_codon:yes stop_codon:yes gene_type:complete
MPFIDDFNHPTLDIWSETSNIAFRLQFYCKRCGNILSPKKLEQGCQKCKDKEAIDRISKFSESDLVQFKTALESHFLHD